MSVGDHRHVSATLEQDWNLALVPNTSTWRCRAPTLSFAATSKAGFGGDVMVVGSNWRTNVSANNTDVSPWSTKSCSSSFSGVVIIRNHSISCLTARKALVLAFLWNLFGRISSVSIPWLVFLIRPDIPTILFSPMFGIAAVLFIVTEVASNWGVMKRWATPNSSSSVMSSHGSSSRLCESFSEISAQRCILSVLSYYNAYVSALFLVSVCSVIRWRVYRRWGGRKFKSDSQ